MRLPDLAHQTATRAPAVSTFTVWLATLFALVAPDAHGLKAPGAPGRAPARVEPSKE